MRKKKNEKNSVFFVERADPSESDSNTHSLRREVENHHTENPDNFELSEPIRDLSCQIRSIFLPIKNG